MIRVVVCDDHTILRRGISNTINVLPNCTVVSSIGDGIFLLPLFQNGLKADIVLLDISMPIVDGYKAAKQLKNAFPEVKTLAYSMFSTPLSIQGMLNAGATGFITKESIEDEISIAIEDMYMKGFHTNKYVSEGMLKEAELYFKQNKKYSYSLTSKEIEILPLLCSDYSYKEIADKKQINVKTVDKHRESICKKLSVKSRVGLTAEAIRMGLIRI